ncbi:MAG: hypothetical protein JWP89_2997 [Schlesneria sp.]|nr:hypothetical protein [Schlesneria sp.]
MVGRIWPLWLSLIVCCGVGGGIAIWMCNLESVASLAERTGNSQPATDRSYEKLPRIVDPERRLEPLGKTIENNMCDLTALVGMPNEYGEVLSEYAQAVLEGIHASPLARRRFYHKDRGSNAGPYPDDANPIYDRDVLVPLVILPRPEAVKKWSLSTEARSLGWRAEDKASENHGSVYGRSLVFEPGKLSENPISVPAAPLGVKIPSWDAYVPEHDTTFFLKLGKVVDTPSYDYVKGGTLNDRSADLHLGNKDGAKLLGEFVTVPAHPENTRLRWVSIQKEATVLQFLAYSLLDGNGARRDRNADLLTNSRLSPYVRPLICERHQPRINQHDELLLPTPLGWPPTSKEWSESHIQNDPHEEWCLDDWFPAQKDACWVIREAEDSKPLQESFLLMPASEKSDRPVFFIALFAETEPKQLLKELAALYNVSADKALNSPETMARLNSLYEKVRDFALDK